MKFGLHIVLGCLVLLGIGVLTACEQPNHSPEDDKAIQHLIQQADSLIHTCDLLPMDSIASWQQKTRNHMEYIRANCVRSGLRGASTPFLQEEKRVRLDTMESLLQRADTFFAQKQEICNNIHFSKQQLFNLQSAIASKATKDGKGNKMDKMYVQGEIAKEAKEMQSLLQMTERLRTFVSDWQVEYNAQKIRIEFWNDSIPPIKRMN